MEKQGIRTGATNRSSAVAANDSGSGAASNTDDGDGCAVDAQEDIQILEHDTDALDDRTSRSRVGLYTRSLG